MERSRPSKPMRNTLQQVVARQHVAGGEAKVAASSRSNSAVARQVD